MRRFAVAAALALIPCSAFAAPLSCTVPATTMLNFGTYNVFNASPTTANGTLNVTCNKNAAPILVSLDSGLHSANFAPRHMSDGTDVLGYNIFTTAALTTIFGDGSNSTQTLSATVPTKNVAFSITLYGEITAAQDVEVGSYGDTVIATVNF